MLRSRTFALLLALALLVLPATSYAQSAGDDQYQDPLAGHGGGSGHSGGRGSSGSSGSTGTSGGSNTAPATQSPSTANTSTPTTGNSPQATAAQASGRQLPRTGFDVIVTIELGLAMLLTGLVAQRTIVLRDRRDS
jgi:hypothetical protein